jgi:hypothetical protein
MPGWHSTVRRPSLRLLALASFALAAPSAALPAKDLPFKPGKKSLAQVVAEAKAGTTVVLPAGTFPGGLTLPAGVSLRGAGYARTTLDAGSSPAGVAVKGTRGHRIEDLTIRTKGSSGLTAEKAGDVQVRRVRILGGALGVRWRDVTGGRVENVVIADAMVGVSLNRVRRVAVVNCTITNASAMGLGLVDARDSAVFNNVIADAGTGVLLSGARRGLALDYNLYRALVVGKVDGQFARISLGPWRDVTGGLDAHSVNLPVAFARPGAGNYRPVSVLHWDPSRATTSDWGVARLAGFEAPDKDIDGAARVGAHDLGAYEAPRLPAPTPHGTFKVADSEGTKSAGVFRPDGTLVRYLFQDLPLKKGTYGFRLPSRTQLGKAVPSGKYELRLVESRLGWTHRGITGNAGVDSSRESTDQAHVALVAFAPGGGLLLGNGWNERNENVRSRDLETGKANWVFNGSAYFYGLCVGADRFVYCLRNAGPKDTYQLSRLDHRTGKPVPWEDAAQANHKLPGATPDGLAELGGTLYLADTKNNKIHYGPAKRPAFGKSFACPAPALPAADPKRKLLWVLSGKDQVRAFSPEGKVVAEVSAVAAPVGLAVQGDRLAVASAKTGKVHFFDCSDPKKLKPLRTVGRGDGPYGPLLPDRFHFQAGPYNASPRPVSLALDEKGRLALRDSSGRVVVLTAKGKALYASISQFGNKPTLAPFAGDKRTRVFDHVGRFSWWVDGPAGKWAPDAYWGLPPNKTAGNPLIGCFSAGGKKFGIFHHAWDDATLKRRRSGILIVRYERHVGRPVLLYTQGKDGWVVLPDTNRDGLIDEKDGAGTPVRDTEGKPVRWHMAARWMFAEPDGGGDFRTMTPIGTDGVGFVWKFKRLDASGVPVYEFPPAGLIRVKQPSLTSAYNFSKVEDARNQSESLLTRDGRFLATFQFRHGPNGMGLSNSGAVDVARYNKDGSLRWLRPMNDFGPLQGIKRMGKSGYLTSWGHQCEWLGLDEDGLSLGRLGFPAAAHWTGMWADHPDQYLTFADKKGGWHVLCGDYLVNGTHWLTLAHVEDYRKSSFPFTLSAGAARALAFRPVRAFEVLGRPAAPRVVVRRLSAPLKIDGDLKKWRTAGITPQILITPVTASGSIKGPKDASAVVRLAYEGRNLYVQVLRFDDVVTFHQPVSKSHLQDTVEIMLNGFMDGFQWSISRFTDAGPAMVRRRFFFGALEERTSAKHAPRVVKVLDDAKAVSERALIEAVYGVDMSDCKVIVTEFKLPIDKVTYRGSEGSLFPVRSGASFWLGFLIDDNDVPGTDVQNLLAWPASFGTFNPKEDGALAVFE